ncbi:hypothetical protein HGRIS_014437 [Hohenbuehelia grisea]|uniref:Uncharacterized protein n=1 Tax=Hohenbuehelia grisea TaxID=104357 RepID=A0ABR3JTF1_9AGAR
MKLTALSCSLFPLALAGFASAGSYAAAEPRSVKTCEARAKEQGKPVDGWKLVDGPYGKQCRRETVDLMCFGEQYYEPDTREAHCCDPPRSVGWVDEEKKLGHCCAENHYFSKDPSSGEGLCCPRDTHFSGGKCRPKKNDNDGDNGNHSDGRCVDLCHMSGGPGPCTKGPVCGNEHNLGIKYGHCYRLSFSDGEQLGSRRGDLTYLKGGEFQDIPFKVCKATTDCSKAGPVRYDEGFYLQDQFGRFNDKDGKPGFISNHQDGNHMMFLDQTLNHLAAEFKGTATCANGNCAIKLYGGSNGERGLGPACPSDNPGITWWANKKIGMSLHFTEMRCDGAAPFAPEYGKRSRSHDEF